MKKSKYLVQKFCLPVALLVALGSSSMASVNMQFTWTGTLYEAGFTADLNVPGFPGYSGQVINGNDAIGIYAFNVSPGSIPNPGSPFYSVCLSPAGLLDGGGPYKYDDWAFSIASPGIYPNQWAVGSSGQPYGINNAAYLWATYGTTVRQSGDSAKAAALEFAVWTALYNSTGYGNQLGNNYFTINGLSGTTLSDYNQFLGDLASMQNRAYYTGNILEGQGASAGPNTGQSQEFFYLGTPVPEPTTMVAGALLLLPFGASTLRFLRKNRAA